MRFSCESCHTRFTIDDDRVAGRMLTVKCKVCGETISVSSLAAEADRAQFRNSRDLTGFREETAISYGNWYYSVDGVSQGPMLFDDVLQVFASGLCGEEAYVWHETFDEWKPVGSVTFFADALQAGARSASRGTSSAGDRKHVEQKPRLDKIDALRRKLKDHVEAETSGGTLKGEESPKGNRPIVKEKPLDARSPAGVLGPLEPVNRRDASEQDIKPASNHAVTVDPQEPDLRKEEVPATEGVRSKGVKSAGEEGRESRSGVGGTESRGGDRGLGSGTVSEEEREESAEWGLGAGAKSLRLASDEEEVPATKEGGRSWLPPVLVVLFLLIGGGGAYLIWKMRQAENPVAAVAQVGEQIGGENGEGEGGTDNPEPSVVAVVEGEEGIEQPSGEVLDGQGEDLEQPKEEVKPGESLKEKAKPRPLATKGQPDEGEPGGATAEDTKAPSETLPPPIQEEPRTPERVFEKARFAQEEDRKKHSPQKPKEPPEARQTGKLTRESAVQGLKKVSKSVELCRERHVRRGGKFDTRKVYVEITVEGTGEVSAVNLEPESIQMTEFARCMKSHRPRWKFEAYGGPPVNVKRRFIFE